MVRGSRKPVVGGQGRLGHLLRWLRAGCGPRLSSPSSESEGGRPATPSRPPPRARHPAATAPRAPRPYVAPTAAGTGAAGPNARPPPCRRSAARWGGGGGAASRHGGGTDAACSQREAERRPPRPAPPAGAPGASPRAAPPPACVAPARKPPRAPGCLHFALVCPKTLALGGGPVNPCLGEGMENFVNNHS